MNYLSLLNISSKLDRTLLQPQRQAPNAGRLMLFELSRHSDHHYLASRKYQVLRHHNHSMQMPTGYPGMMLLAHIPPLWFYTMNKRIKKEASVTMPLAG